MARYAVIDFSLSSVSLLVAEQKMNGGLESIFKSHRIIRIPDYLSDGLLEGKGLEKLIKESLYLMNMAAQFNPDKTFAISSTLLKGIGNAEEVGRKIKECIGLDVLHMEGKDEAYAAFIANERYKNLERAVLIDIGGSSTEICDFRSSDKDGMVSIDIGANQIERMFIKDLYPTGEEEKKIRRYLKEKIDEETKYLPQNYDNAVLSGSNCQALYTIYADYYDIPDGDEMLMQTVKLEKLISTLMEKKKRSRLIIKTVPEKVNLLIPTAICLKQILKRFGIENMTVSTFGVKEGALKLILSGRMGGNAGEASGNGC